MSRSTYLALVVALVIACMVSSCTAQGNSQGHSQAAAHNGKGQQFIATENNDNVPFISYVTFPQRQPFNSAQTGGLNVAGRLKVPKVNGTLPSFKVPAVVMVHGSGGLDSRGELHSYNLVRQGIAVLEIDLWAVRGWYGGITGRARSVSATLPDVFGALYFLANNVPAVDSTRIGLIGFSWGGVATMLSATEPYTALYSGTAPDRLRFQVGVAHYPICWGYNHVPSYEFASFTGMNVLIQTGELDDYDTPTSCSNLLASLPASSQSLFHLNMYENATHAFDRLEPTVVVSDPFSHQGRGGLVTMSGNPEAAEEAVAAQLSWFKSHFGL